LLLISPALNQIADTCKLILNPYNHAPVPGPKMLGAVESPIFNQRIGYKRKYGPESAPEFLKVSLYPRRLLRLFLGRFWPFGGHVRLNLGKRPSDLGPISLLERFG